MRTGQNIYKRRDGRWEARVPLGKKADGRPHFKYLYASTYREVLLQKNNYEKTISLKNTQVISTALFSDAAYNWLLNSARRWKPSTYIKYKNCLEKYILPQWKKLYVRDIQQGTYDRLMKVLQQELSGGSIRTINTIISGILKHTLNYLPVKCTGSVSDHAKRPLDFLSEGESCRLLAYLEDNNDLISIGIRLTLFSGIRLGDDDDKIRLNQRKPSKYKGLRRFGPEKNLQRINRFMKERPIFYKNLIQMKENFRFYLRCFYCITKVVILQFNSENRTELARNG